MKHLLLSLLFFACSTASFSQSDGVQFDTPENWDSVIEEALISDKIIFVNVFTDWCAPCKSMDRYIFSVSEIGDFYNEHFINVRVNAERGIGPSLVQEHKINAIPTFLYITGEGQVVHREVGYLREHELLEHGEKALDPSRNLSKMRERYEVGEDDPVFLQQFSRMLVDAGDPLGREVIARYLETQDDWLLRHNMEFIMLTLNDINTKEYDFVVANFDRFVEVFGEDLVFNLLEKPLFDALYDPEAGSEVLRKADALYQKVLPEDADNLSNITRVYYYEVREEWTAYSREVTKYIENNIEPIGWNELNEHAWNFFLFIEEPPLLQKAVEWAETSVDLDENFFNLTTLAHLYAKVGKVRSAKSAAHKAMAIAEDTGQDASALEVLLEGL